MKLKTLMVSLLAVLLIGSQAGAVTIKGKALSSISDILKQSRGLADKGSDNLDLSKASFIRVNDGHLYLHYNIGNGDKDLSLGDMFSYSTTNLMRDNGILAVPIKTRAGKYKSFITSSKALSDSDEWFFHIYFQKPGLKPPTFSRFALSKKF